MRTLLQKAQNLLPRAVDTKGSGTPARPAPTVRPDIFQASASGAKARSIAQLHSQLPPVSFVPTAKLALVQSLAQQAPEQRTAALLQQLREATGSTRRERLGEQLRETAPQRRLAYLEEALGSLTDTQQEALLASGRASTGDAFPELTEAQLLQLRAAGITDPGSGTGPLALTDRETLERFLGELGAPTSTAPAPYDGPVYDGVTPAEGTTSPSAALPVDAPLTNVPGARSPEAYDNVINQFAVGTNPRYAIRDSSGDGVADTFCNIFTSDVMSAMGAPLPHWVNADGSPAEAGAPGARELSANGTYAWLEQHGAEHGWREITAEEAQARANEGHPTLVTYDEPGGIGHIAVVRPGELTEGGPAIAQAGLVNTNQAHVTDMFGDKPVKYYVHDGGGTGSTTSAPDQAPSTAGDARPAAVEDGLVEGLPMSPLTPRVPVPAAGLAPGDTGEDVLALQQWMVSEGFLTQEQLATGPGIFGPQTEAAVRAYQRTHGLPDTGYYGPMTEAALTSSAHGPSRPGVTGTGQAPVSAPGDAARATSDGGLRQHEVTNISQLYSEGTDDDWNRLANCGPASLAMIARTFGYGDGMSDGALVNSLGGSIGITPLGTGWPGVIAMAEGIGLTAEHRPGSDLAWIDAELASGNLIAANGDRGVTLEHSTYTDGETGGHWIVVTGKDENGNYLVQDPSTDCKVLSPAELQRFLDTRVPDGGHLVSVGP